MFQGLMCGILAEWHYLPKKIISKHSNSHKLYWTKACSMSNPRPVRPNVCVCVCAGVYVFVKWMNDNGVCASLEDLCSELKFGEPVSAQLYKQWVTFILQPVHEGEFECVVHDPVHLPQWQKNDPLCQVTLVSEQRGGEVKHVKSHGRSDSVWVCVCVDVR